MPNRVIVNFDGYAVPANIAEKRYGIVSDIIFKRNDNWTLGAPKEYESIAYTMWKEQWVEFKTDGEWRSIDEYT